MNLPDELQRKIEDYLRAVDSHLGSRSAAVRRELLNELREHIAEALRRRCSAAAPTAADLEAVLGELDAPESYAEEAGASAATPAPCDPHRRSTVWLLLALAALALNGWAVWRLTHQPPAGGVASPGGQKTAAVAPASLRLDSVEQINLSPDREATLRLSFTARPSRTDLKKYLRLMTPDKKEQDYVLVGAAGVNVVLIRTGPLSFDQLCLELAKGLPAVGGPPATDSAWSIDLEITSKLQLTRIEPQAPAFGDIHLECQFTEQLDPSAASPFIEVSPVVKFTAEQHWRGCALSGPFQPGAIYTLTFRAGLRSVNGRPLFKDVVRTVQIPNRRTAVAIATDGRYLSPRGQLTVPVSAMNLRACEISLAPVLPQNLVFLAQRDGGRNANNAQEAADRLTDAAATVTNRLAAPLNTEAKFSVHLRDLAGPEPRGLYLLSVRKLADSAAERPYYSGRGHRHYYYDDDSRVQDHKLIAVTDLGLAARLSSGELLVWVNSLGTAKPVAGAELVLYAENNTELARGATDARGLVTLRFKQDDKAAAPFLVVARAGADFSFLPLEGTQVNAAGETDGRPYLADGYEAYLFSDRGVYRPGETVHLQALVRDRHLEAPPAFPALFRVVKPNGRVFRDVPIQLDAQGAAETAVTLPEFLPTGRYECRLVLPGTFKELGATPVALEEFVPPQIRVRVETPAARVAAGRPVPFAVRAEHLFGRLAAGLKARGYVTLRPAPFAPKAWPEWRFGDEERKFAETFKVDSERVLDAQGSAAFAIPTSDAWRPPAAIRVGFQATVTESSGRPVTAHAQTLVDVYPFYIGLKTGDRDVVRVGETQQVAVVEVAGDGAAWTNAKPLAVRLDRVAWNTVLRRDDRGRYQWQSEEQKTKVLEDTCAAGGQPSDYAFSVSAPGQYLLTFSHPASGAASSFRFYAGTADQQWLSWSREKPDVVELTLDKPSYRPGDMARLLIKAPFAGQALLTIESNHVLESRVIELAKNTAEAELAVRPDYAPNVYCSLTLIRPAVAESVWTAHRATGATPLKVVPPGRRLVVTLDAPATNRPQARLTAKVRVTDESGAPAAADLAVMAVDEAICMLTAYPMPDPLKWFLGQRALGVNLFDVYGELMPVVDDAALGTAAHPAGGAAADLGRRLNPIKANRFKPVALWVSQLHTGTNGEAEAGFDVPEFTGELRLTAVAWNRAQFGAQQQNVKIKRALVAQPSLPRFLAPGDRCFASVALFNESGAPVQARLRVTCGGPLNVEQAEQDIPLPPGEARNVVVPLAAGTVPGKALCTIEAEAGTERYRETIELAVRPAAGLAVDAGFGALKAGEQRTMLPPANWIPATLRQEVWCSGQPALKLGRGLDYLLHYPYGCLEQTTSAAFPLLYLADLANRVLPRSMGRDETEQFVQAGVLRVLSMQQGHGGFNLWPDSTMCDEGAAIYAAHFLVEARRAAYDVPTDRLDAALSWLRSRLDSPVPDDVGSSAWQADMTVRAYACQVLALAGKPEHGWTARLREEARRLPFDAQVHTAAALLAAGEPRQATELMTALGLPDAGRPRAGGCIAAGGVREAALLLSAWLDIAPQHENVARLAQALDRQQKDGHWGTTQDNALVLLALGKYARLVPAAQPFAATLALPGGLTRVVNEKQAVHWSNGTNQTGAVTLRNDGPGLLFYASRAEGVPLDGAQPEEDAGLKVRREWLDLNGATWGARAVAQGDLIVVRITVDTLGRELDNLVIEELLPAGLEIENPNLATAALVPWLKEKSDWCIHRDLRDDRLVLFTGPVVGQRAFYYAARAVTSGRFVLPAVSGSCMYDPEIRSVHGRGTLEIKP